MMVEMSKESVRALAQELLMSERRQEEIEEELENGSVEIARILLLGVLDARVDGNVLPDDVAAEFYKRLGFTSQEMSGFRQYRAQREHIEGKDLPKKLS